MKCFKPLKGYRVSPPGGEKPYVIFKDKIPNGYPADPVEIRCGNCIGCRLTKSRDWSIRIMHEASQHIENSFITLTYDQDHLPQNANLEKKDFQDFMKRLRKQVPNKIRYYMCGEYGTDKTQHQNLGRPHYHAIIFGHAFIDDRMQKQKRGQHWVYHSPTLEKVWGKGMTEIGDVTVASAAYVSGYVTKKINGQAAKEYYLRINKVTGEAVELQPEYAEMSRRPGVGRGWFEKYNADLEKGFFTINGKRYALPQYYQDLMDRRNPHALERIKERAKISLKKQDQWNLEAEERQTHSKQKARSNNL